MWVIADTSRPPSLSTNKLLNRSISRRYNSEMPSCILVSRYLLNKSLRVMEAASAWRAVIHSLTTDDSVASVNPASCSASDAFAASSASDAFTFSPSEPHLDAILLIRSASMLASFSDAKYNR